MDKNYKSIQLDDDTHRKLKEYCEYHGYKMSGLIRKWTNEVYRTLDSSKREIEPQKVLKVK